MPAKTKLRHPKIGDTVWVRCGNDYVKGVVTNRKHNVRAPGGWLYIITSEQQVFWRSASCIFLSKAAIVADKLSQPPAKLRNVIKTKPVKVTYSFIIKELLEDADVSIEAELANKMADEIEKELG